MIDFKDLVHYKRDALIFKDNDDNCNLAFINKIKDDSCLFHIYKNGIFEDLEINKKNFSNYKVYTNPSVVRVGCRFDKNEFFKNTMLFKNDLYNLKFLGFSESSNDNGDYLSIRLYFSSHGKYAELSFYDPGQLSRDDWYFVSYKESESIFDFDLNPSYAYEINDAEQIITPCILTGEKMIENDEISDCADENEKSFLGSTPEIDGYDFGRAIFVVDNDIFVSKIYINYSEFKSISRNDFIKQCFNIEIQNEINER